MFVVSIYRVVHLGALQLAMLQSVDPGDVVEDVDGKGALEPTTFNCKTGWVTCGRFGNGLLT